MSYVGRFAPSPTGPLHFGSLVAALASYLDAKAHGGVWLVRMEDIDETRCKAKFADEILQSLIVFGLRWDGEVITQTARKALYGQALGALRGRGLVYACACSRKEIADSSINGIDGSVYPGSCRDKGYAETGKALRLITNSEPIQFQDPLQGEVIQQLERDIGDFVLRRRDGLFSYQLAVVVDDAAQGVSHVVRGADLLGNTARQLYLQRLLGYPQPQYLHIPIAVNALGQKLAKQTRAKALDGANAQELLCAALDFLGQPTLPGTTSVADIIITAIKNWDRNRIPRGQTRFVPSINPL